jgi:hypothetical protein
MFAELVPARSTTLKRWKREPRRARIKAKGDGLLSQLE